MRLARDEQHAQPVAHALDHGDGAVVLGRDLALQRRGGDLHDVLAAVADGDGDVEGLARRHGEALGRAAADGDGHAHRLAGAVCFLDAEAHRLFLAHHAEARGLLDHHLAVLLAPRAGDDGVQRAAGVGLRRVLRRIVHLPVGDHDGAGEALGRNVGQRAVQRLEGARAVVLRADAGLHLDGAQFSVGQPGDRRLQRRFRLGRAGVAAGTFLAERAVDHRNRDVGQRLALLVAHRRVGEGGKQDGQRQGAQQGAAGARQGKRCDQHEAEHAHDGDDRPGQHGVEADAPGTHWPSLSSRAGTWTWSAL